MFRRYKNILFLIFLLGFFVINLKIELSGYSKDIIQLARSKDVHNSGNIRKSEEFKFYVTPPQNDSTSLILLKDSMRYIRQNKINRAKESLSKISSSSSASLYGRRLSMMLDGYDSGLIGYEQVRSILKGVDLAMDKNYEKAADIFESVVAENSESLYARFFAADTYSKMGVTPLVIRHTVDYLKVDPKDTDMLFLLAAAYYRNGDYKKAENVLKSSLRINPGNVYVLTNLAIIYLKLDKTGMAIHCLNDAINTDPKYSPAHQTLGNANYSLSKYEQSIKSYETVLRLKPKDVNAHINIAGAYYKLEKFDEALGFLNNALTHASRNITLDYNLGLVYKALDNHREASKYFKKVLSKNSNDIDARLNLAECYQNLGDKINSLDSYKKVIEANPAAVSAYEGLGLLYKSMQDCPQAIKYLLVAKELYQNVGQFQKVSSLQETIKLCQ
jgi:tetratricopeptide (TPR) repeat protein